MDIFRSLAVGMRLATSPLVPGRCAGLVAAERRRRRLLLGPQPPGQWYARTCDHDWRITFPDASFACEDKNRYTSPHVDGTAKNKRETATHLLRRLSKCMHFGRLDVSEDVGITNQRDRLLAVPLTGTLSRAKSNMRMQRPVERPVARWLHRVNDGRRR